MRRLGEIDAIDLLMGTGDYPLGGGQGGLFRLDPAGDIVLRHHLGRLQSGGEQTPALDPPERVSGVDKRDAQYMGEPAADITGIGIVAVDQVRILRFGVPNMLTILLNLRPSSSSVVSFMVNGPPGTTSQRSLAFGASTPWKRIRRYA